MSAVVKVRDVAEWLTANEDFVDAADATSIARRLAEELGDADDWRVPYERVVTYRLTASSEAEAEAIWKDFGPGAPKDGVSVYYYTGWTEVVA
jgi:hypothetical protein